MASKWPPQSGPTTPIMPRDKATFSVAASIEIDAPALVAWELLIDTKDWQSWNTFVPRVKIASQPDGVDASSKILHNGTHMVFDVIMNPAKPDKIDETSLGVVDISTPDKPSDYVPREMLEEENGSFTKDLSKVYRVSWKLEGAFAGRGLMSQRFNEIIVTGENTCEIRTWECYGGVMGTPLKWMYNQTIQTRFEDWCRDVKKQAEKVSRESRS